MLPSGTAADELDETLKIAASTSLECLIRALDKFALGVIEVFGEEYLRPQPPRFTFRDWFDFQ
jgi:hypothetical protein